jgi:hypothetical protein
MRGFGPEVQITCELWRNIVLLYKYKGFATATHNQISPTPTQHALQTTDLTQQIEHHRIRYPILVFK